ncbi:MAG: hypothetical protein A2V66_05620 [Ignavibacteria bacterium RBG_13_36_8]|nr:MAG: hypothetical protein A2V66_05620 [Ignavibacteria bacterium RBG_13_36_8]
MRHGFILLCILTISHVGLTDCNNEPGTNIISPPQDSVTCIDSNRNVYPVVKIGNQYWMSENLRVTHTAEGNLLSGVYIYNNNDDVNVSIYGRLYTWQTALDACPEGWHLPTYTEWQILFDFLGGRNIAGGALKETGTEHWDNPNVGATNSAGFNARGSGFRGPDGNYYSQKQHCDFWGVTNNSADPYSVYLYNNSSQVISESNIDDRTSGIAFSVRYIKN